MSNQLKKAEVSSTASPWMNYHKATPYTTMQLLKITRSSYRSLLGRFPRDIVEEENQGAEKFSNDTINCL